MSRRLIHINPELQHRHHHGDIAVHRGKKECGPALRIRAANVLPAPQCGLHRGQVANLGRLEERGARRADLFGKSLICTKNKCLINAMLTSDSTVKPLHSARSSSDFLFMVQ